MPLQYSHEGHAFRVDGDLLETFIRGASQQRILLAWLAVRVFPIPRGHLAVNIGAAPPDWPLYEAMQKAKGVAGTGATLQVNISPEEEPALRAFFTQVAQLCGRPVAP